MISPRHRHNFEQIKLGLEGTTYFGHQGLKPRMISYFPAGTKYGPQKVDDSSIQLILQYDGLGLRAHANQQRLKEAMQDLSARGRFERGFFFPNDGGPGQDAGEAVFEHATGHKIEYPPQRYLDPLYMYIDGFPAVEQEGGASLKKIGEFGWPQTAIEVCNVNEDATAEIASEGGPVICFVLSGSLELNGTTLPKWSAILLEEEDSITARALAAAELVLIRLPDFRSQQQAAQLSNTSAEQRVARAVGA
jgi:hypothetical protein